MAKIVYNRKILTICFIFVVINITILCIVTKSSALPKEMIDKIKIRKIASVGSGESKITQSVSVKKETTPKEEKPKSPISCYREKIESLQDISEVIPEKGNSIFFHETSCSSFVNGKITITARQACAVESAAKTNPNKTVYLLFAAPGLIKLQNTSSDKYLEALMTYKNIKLHHLNYEKYTKNTPVEGLYASGKIEASTYAQSHASDVLRYLTLYKYGGIYLDLDVIVVKSFNNLPKNFAGLESKEQVAAGIIGFDHNGIGHMMASYCVDTLKDKFDGSSWINNGPGTITRLFENVCGKNKLKEMRDKECM